MPSIDKREFYQQASKRLLGTMRFEKAMQDCLRYIADHVPAEYFSVHFYDPGLGVVETVVDASAEESVLGSQITTLSPEARQLFQALVETKGPECVTFERLSENEVARQLGLDLKTPDAACMAMDMVVDDVLLGFVTVSNTRGALYSAEHTELLLAIHDPLAMACSQFRRFRELSRLKEILADNARQLQKDLMHGLGDEVVGSEYGLKPVMARVEQVAAQDSSVLLLGETGAGKEVIAWAVHRLSPRCEGPFIKINCGAIPPGLIESELFGHEKGAFTGAIARRRGCFERADSGTLLLDEIGELPLQAQVRLLRVLQDHCVERVGGSDTTRVDVRVLAATNRDLQRMVEAGEFRSDLFFRLNVFPIVIPPLRERTFDIPALAHHLIIKKAHEMGLTNIPPVEPGAIDRLTDYDWPGNVRELQNIIERELIIRPKGPLTFAGFQPGTSFEPPPSAIGVGIPEATALDQVVIRHITWALEQTRGKVEGPGSAAELLDINPRTLRNRMKKLGIPFGRKVKGVYRN